VTATIRRDGSSKFAEGNRWGWFPSAALAWKIKNESFLKDNDVINNLKLRLGWGATGNQNVENWAYMALLSSKSTPWGTGVLNGNTANPDLKWETTYSTNVGLDLNMFDNRIEFIADVYYKKTKDLLLQLPLPSYLGSGGSGAASNPWANVGSLENKGIELTLNTVNLDRKGFSWRSNFVFSLNRNKVLSLDTESASIEKTFSVGSETNTVTRTVVGQPIGQFWGYKVIGRFDKAEDFYYKDASGNVKQVAIPEGSSIEEGKTWIGDYIFADLNGDGVINNSDCTFIGNPNPKFTYGIGNTFSWKGFDLTIFLSGSYGNDVLNYTKRWIENPRVNSNLLKSAANYAIISKIDPDGPDDYRNLYVSNASSTTLPRLSASTTNENNRVSDLYIEDGSYLRIQNISLAYNFPKKWISKLSIQNLRVYANLQNVYTWSKYDGYDPEIGCMYGDALMNGLDYGRYPSPRVYTFGLNVSF
jgi:TonB-linked SusC/RagA family outer membrane protein